MQETKYDPIAEIIKDLLKNNVSPSVVELEDISLDEQLEIFDGLFDKSKEDVNKYILSVVESLLSVTDGRKIIEAARNKLIEMHDHFGDDMFTKKSQVENVMEAYDELLDLLNWMMGAIVQNMAQSIKNGMFYPPDSGVARAADIIEDKIV